MTDFREEILNRLTIVAGAVANIKTSARNRVSISDVAKPALIILDGAESTEAGYGRGKGSLAPLRVQMTPQVLLYVGGLPEDVGTSLGGFRANIVRDVLTDATLRDLSLDDDIRYEGCQSGFAAGRQIEADMVLTFTFRYLLNPQTL